MKDMNFNQLCGKKIKDARTAKSISQEDLAFTLNKDDYTKELKLIKYWEKGLGFPDLNDIYKLAEILELDPNEIMHLREMGRKNLSDAKKLTDKQVRRRDKLEKNLDDFFVFLPGLIGAFLIIILLNGVNGIMTALDIIIHPIRFILSLFGK